MAQDVIPHIAERYLISEEAARQVERSLRSTGGGQAQFNHPDLGGFGQWMPGMLLIARADDEQLKRRVAGLCAEIAAIVTGSETSSPRALSRDPSTGAAAACSNLSAGESWWPAALGHPSSTGDQNGVRYAFFPDRSRLLIQIGGRIDAYDTGGRQINGVSQQQGHSLSSLRFTGPSGEVDLASLQQLEMPIEM